MQPLGHLQSKQQLLQSISLWISFFLIILVFNVKLQTVMNSIVSLKAIKILTTFDRQ